MESKQWLHSNISTSEAEQLLLEKGVDGSFLIRPSTTTPGIITLSARLKGKVTHIRIQNTGDYYDLYAGKFATLVEIVDYYTGKDEGTDGDISEPRYPLYSTDPTNERWFHGDISGLEARRLFKNAEKGSFIVRASQSMPGDFVLSVKADDKATHIKIKSQDGKFGFDQETKQYDTLSELIDDCQDITVTTGGGQVVYLTQPLNTTKIKVSEIDNKVKTLEKINHSAKNGFWRDFEQLQYQEWKNVYSREDGQKTENIGKNRYKNILPFDHTRVILRLGDPNVEGSDYINANILTNVKDDNSHMSYIATQGCLQHTVHDFWHMVWQEDCRFIVMLTKLYEWEQDICIKYWPDGNYDKKEMNLHREKLIIKFLNEINTPEFVIRAFEVYKEGEQDCEFRRIYQYQFTTWPDQGVPQDPRGLLEIIQQITEQQELLLASDRRQSPVVVHCSGGVGRTGAFIVIDMIIKTIKTQGLDCMVDIPGIIQMVRAQRSGMVQTEAQYKLVYRAVQYYVKNLQQEMQTDQGSQRDTSYLDKSAGDLDQR